MSRKLPITPLPNAVTVTLADSASQLRAVDEVQAEIVIRGSTVCSRALVLDDLPHGLGFRVRV